MEQQRDDIELMTVVIEEAATRPPMFVGLIPAKLAALLFLFGSIALVLTSSLRYEVSEIALVLMVAFGVKPLVARDYHAFENLVVWFRLDLCALDTREWGGTRISTFPKRLRRQYGMAAYVR